MGAILYEFTEAFLQKIKKQYPDYEHIVSGMEPASILKNSEHEIVPQ